VKKTYELLILNQKLVLKSDADEKHVKKLSDYVNKKLHTLAESAKNVSTLNIAILGALTIADDFFKYQGKTEKKISNWIEKVDEVMKKIEE